MAEIVNLRTARKAKARSAARTTADGNAAKFGRTKSQKALEKTEAEKARAALDGHRLDPGSGPE
ncbi:MAG TPA: DUF4169 family protein [Paracoccaceae bacterium]|nr:DUF4169 family protein [Paracoccaceae bacterium]